MKNMKHIKMNKYKIFLNGFEIGEAEAEAEAAAVINDAFPSPHANFQFFIVNRDFECLICDLLPI